MMQPLRRSGVSLWILLLLCALPENSSTGCNDWPCVDTGTGNFTVTTTTVSLVSRPNCALSTENNIHGNGSLTGLTSGVVYQVFINCSNCCKAITTKPEVIRNLTVMNVTTSTVSLTWTQPVGNSSLYRVYWTDGRLTGTLNGTKTFVHITDLTAGVKYEISVTAVAADGHTGGQSFTVVRYTKPGIIGKPTVSSTTSSISLTWPAPPGQVFMYRLEWHNGGELRKTMLTNNTSAVLSELTSGSNHTITVVAVAGDNKTQGDPYTFTSFTKPNPVLNVAASPRSTTSVAVKWSYPVGAKLYYKYVVETYNITGGPVKTTTVDSNSTDILDLEPGNKYNISVRVIAASGSESTEEQTLSYTKPGIIGQPTVSLTTSSISLTWPAPPGQVFMYRLEWHNGEGLPTTMFTNNTFAVLSELTSGSNHTITVIAVAGDNKTQGEPYTFTSFTKPNPVLNVAASPRSATSVAVKWSYPVGAQLYYKYVVETYNITGGLVKTTTVDSNSTDILDLEPGNKYNISVRVIAASGSESTEEQTLSYTKPGIIGQPTVSSTTSSISLTWPAPPGQVFMYRLEWHNGGGLRKTMLTNNTSAVLSELTSGSNHTITVVAVAGDNKTQGDPYTFTSFTKPNPVLNVAASPRSTTSVAVKWSYPVGAKLYYKYVVETYNITGGLVMTTTVDSNSTDILDLEPGNKYNISVRVIAASGSESTEEQTLSYTKPGIIGQPTVSSTTSSISLTWPAPPGQVFMYRLEWHNGGGLRKTMLTNNTSAVLSELTSGSNHTITVIAVAGDNKTQGDPYTFTSFTKPNPVLNVAASPRSTTSVAVKWSYPVGAQLYYKYVVETYNITGGLVKTTTVDSNSTDILDLEPGNKYNISVRVIAASGSESTEEQTLSYTKPGIIGQPTVSSTTSSISLTWAAPPGQVFMYRLEWHNGGGLRKTMLTNNTSAVLSELTSGSNHTITVIAVAGDNKTQGDPYTFTSFTKPNPVLNVAASPRSTTSVAVKWSYPVGAKLYYKYVVETYNITGGLVKTTTVDSNSTDILDLEPGNKYNISVRVIAASGSESTKEQTLSYTKPGIIGQPTVSSTTSSISLTWPAPPGQVFMYRLEWHNGEGLRKTMLTNNTSAVLSELTSGSNHTITVVAVAGDNKTQGDPYTFTSFTKPNPVLNVAASPRSTTSVAVKWSYPVGAKLYYKYVVETYNITGGLVKTTTVDSNSTDILDLEPGNKYNISVRVIAASGSESTEEQTLSYTKPGIIGQPTVSSTTSSISLTWPAPPGQVFMYRLEWHNGEGLRKTMLTNNTSAVLSELTSGSNHTITVIAVAGDNKTQGDPYTFTSFTKPNPVLNVAASPRSTTSVAVKWSYPVGAKLYYKYVVETYNITGGLVKTTTVDSNSTDILDLEPGNKYNISVRVIAASGIESTEEQTLSYTKPGIIGQPTVSSTTSSISLTWPAPPGQVFMYRLEWHNGEGLRKTMLTNNTSAVLSELTSGSNHTITVIAVAGDNKTQGDPYTFTSFTKPGIIGQPTVSSTTSSISLTWPAPPGQVFMYRLEWHNGGGLRKTMLTNNTSAVLSELTSGSNHTITVIAVAGDNKTQGDPYTFTSFTKPNPVLNVAASPRSTTSVAVKWSYPVGAKLYYKYVVETYNITGGLVKTTTVDSNSTDILDLEPGNKYNISVRVIAASGSESTEEQTLSYTKPGIIWQPTVSSTTSSISLTWPAPPGQVFMYRLEWHNGGGLRKTMLTNNTSAVLSELTSGSNHTITVIAVAGDNKTQGDPYTFTSFTKPNPVLNVAASPRSTTSVAVKWSYPVGAHLYYKYVVETYNITGGLVKTTTVDSNSTDILDLEPGNKYNISVRVIAASGSESTEEQTLSYTKPGIIGQPTVSSTTSSISLTWAAPPGQVFMYRLEWHNGGGLRKTMLTNNTSAVLSELTSGSNQTITVIAVAGDNKTQGDPYTFTSFTKPNPVLNVAASPRSTTSVAVKWSYPVGAKLYYKYVVETYNITGGLVKTTTVDSNSTDILDLEPGNKYNISVRVIAASGSESTKEQTLSYTKPGIIWQPTVSSTTSSISLTWPAPPGQVFMYRLEWHNGGGLRKTMLTNNTSAVLSELTSGSNHTITIIAVAGDNKTQGDPYTFTSFTKPNPVLNVAASPRSTTSVAVKWSYPVGAQLYYKYVVETFNITGGLVKTTTVDSNSTDILDLEPGNKYNISIRVIAASGRESTEEQTLSYTMPKAVTNLTVRDVTTTAIRLTWLRQSDYKPSYSYLVLALQNATEVQKNRSETESYTFSHLKPGNLYTFFVFTYVEEVKSTGENTSNYTRPDSVTMLRQERITATTVTLVWEQLDSNTGQSYVVLVTQNTFSFPEDRVFNTTFTSTGLVSGINTSFTVTTQTKDGTPAAPVTVHYFTRPHSITGLEVKTLNTTSGRLVWSEPLQYKNEYKYRVQTTGCSSQNQTVQVQAAEISALTPGTNCTFCVFVIAADGTEGEGNCTSQYTAALRVKSVVARSTEEDNITVEWDPVEYTGSFHYHFKWTNRHGLQNITTQETTYTIDDLDPGSRHNFSVTPEISDGKPGITTRNSSCTNASPVNNLKCEGPNEPEAKIILSWNKPRGQHSGLRVTADDVNFTILTNTSYNYTVVYPHHNTKYRQTVVTLSCGPPSSPVFCESFTGITVPPIPPNLEELLVLTGVTHNKFSLEINRELLDDSKGRVTHVGVLVKNNPDGVDASNLKKYMRNTYDQWRAGKTPMYLATVKERNPQSRSGGNHLNIEVGDQTKWNGYTNGALDATGQYQYAIVLFTNVTLTQDELVNFEESLASVTNLFTVVILPQNPAVIGVAVGATLGIFCILFIILIGFIIYWKRFSRKEPSDIQIQSMRAKVSLAVRIEDYEKYYKKQRADSNCGFAEEFEDLKAVGTAQSRTSALTIENKSKNRYSNVLPYDFSRVKLSIIHGNPFDDYINANYMPGYNSRKEFIAAQGPLPVTVSDFWRMIWEKNVLTLVMLTRCNEQGRVKCEQYWGFDTKNCENITVTTTSDIPLDDWTIRDFDIKNVKTAETRSVRQFHFTAWPDHGVPETTELLIDFRHLVREHMDQFSRHSPTVVHCSAGVGRTGTFIAIDRLIFQIERDNCVDVYGIVHDQRMHRTLMVQTEDQYVFLNQCAMDIIRSRTGTNVDLIYQNVAALSEYENIKPQKR
ncbi:receptor-type tyrosine-protein phosphatase beta-like isoform X5 [Limanda limanda]|uniref:receptor-type tyrosine-protein phosphatase beta-like isoform X5 n=1 Tax=Limanda limanda TaxID=27771 RepID=UPI0029C85604|nr:receptor-type tyrosine-protein phosphatase beta-like isoform X5 [Limanda limanda]